MCLPRRAQADVFETQCIPRDRLRGGARSVRPNGRRRLHLRRNLFLALVFERTERPRDASRGP
eukprot:220029-Pyramimonas_sp.AAC.1